jgi:hypothetical protein
MRLILHYRGPLKSNGAPEHKHDIRQHFHKQLKKLWEQKPLSENPALLQPRKDREYCLLRPFGAFTFVPLVSEEMNVVAELDITLLRPEPPGGLVTRGGDIDNRLKTLFDSLAVPPQPNALPPSAVPAADENPFFCLLEDDNLITAVAVNTLQLLEPVPDPSIVDISIKVHTAVTRQTMGNSAFGW